MTTETVPLAIVAAEAGVGIEELHHRFIGVVTVDATTGCRAIPAGHALTYLSSRWCRQQDEAEAAAARRAQARARAAAIGAANKASRRGGVVASPTGSALSDVLGRR